MNTESVENTREIGKRFENYTADWLSAQGYKILKQNFEAKHKEIDIIAMKKGTICFVEVKAEKLTVDNANRDTPPEKITATKIRNIIFGAKLYIEELRYNGIDPEEFCYRFDGVGILFDSEYNVREFKYFKELYKVDEESFL